MVRSIRLLARYFAASGSTTATGTDRRWAVRAFTRKILGRESAGRLDPRDFGIEPKQRTTRGVVSGLVFSLFIGLAMTVLVILAKVTAERLGLTDCMFPPCF